MPRLSYCLIAIALAAPPALADVTPRQVWDDWVAVAGSDGFEAASVEEDGGRLVVRGLTMTAGTSESGRYAIAVDEIVLTQNPDGTVAVTTSPSYPITLTEDGLGGTLQETRLRIEHPDLEMTVADEGGVRVHSFAAPEIRVIVEELKLDGEVLDLEGGATLTDVTGRYDVGGSDDGRSELAAAGASVQLRGTDPDTDAGFAVEAQIDGVESANMIGLLGPDPAAMARAVPEGATREASLRTGATTFRFDSDEPDEPVTLSGTMGPGATLVTLSREGMRYQSDSEGGTIVFSGGGMPIPEVSAEIGVGTLTLAIPLLADGEEQPYAFSLSLSELSFDDGLWNMFDPAAVLPRTPGTLALDVSGNATLSEDLNAAMTGLPGSRVGNVDINAFRVGIAGAELLADGALRMTGDSGTQPVGEIGVTLIGAAELLGKLVQVGLVPQEQAVSAQMMLGMFARPGASEGELVSRIRLAEDGSVFVNDQQIR